MPSGTVVQMAICRFWLKIGRTPLKSGTSHKITASKNQPTRIVVALMSAVIQVDVMSDEPVPESVGAPDPRSGPPWKASGEMPPPGDSGKAPPPPPEKLPGSCTI